MQRIQKVKPVSDQEQPVSPQQEAGRSSERQQRFEFSANRGNARHRLRYKEGDASLLQSNDCFFCRSGS